MITQKRQLGNRGEDIACKYLISKGYSVLERNYNTKFGEIDVIARKSGVIHFIEVKSGNNNKSAVHPIENLTGAKIRKFTKTTQSYLFHKNISDKQRWQIDAIVVIFNSSDTPPEITHLENINIS